MATRNDRSSIAPAYLGQAVQPLRTGESGAAYRPMMGVRQPDPSKGQPVRVALVGYGAINRRVAAMVMENVAGPTEIVAIARRNVVNASVPPGARFLHRPADLLDVRPDIVVEAASREAVGEWGEAALGVARAYIVCSASAFTDETLHDHFRAIAEDAGSRLVISPGAIAGTEALAAAGLSGFDRMTHTIVKPPAGWRGTPAEEMVDLDALDRPTSFYTGSAREAAALFPANANVSVATALFSGHGLDATRVELVADPDSTTNRHLIAGTGGFGRISIEVDNRPFAENPRSSQLAALALVRLVRDEVAAAKQGRASQARTREMEPTE
jgi:aspartate dehydrogenase